MSRIVITNASGVVKEEIELADDLLVLDRGAQALKDVLVAYRAGLRSGTASTKTKAQVAGSNRKPWAQKGLGRARAGYRQSPVWRGGGVVFGPHPRSYAKHTPRKVARLAFRRALSEKIKDQALHVVDELNVAEPKTRALLAVLEAVKVSGRVLIILDRQDRQLGLAARNLKKVEIVLACDVHPYQLLRYPTLLATKSAWAVLEKRLKPMDETGKDSL